MSSDGKLYRLPTVGVGTTAPSTTTGSGPPAQTSSKSNRPVTQPLYSDLNNNQVIHQSSSFGNKSLAINQQTTRTTGNTSSNNSRAVSSPPISSSSSPSPSSNNNTTRQIEEVQVSLVINRTSISNHGEKKSSNESDIGVVSGGGGSGSEDVPFKSITTQISTDSSKSAAKDSNLRRSSANLASETATLGIEMPDTKIGKLVFILDFCSPPKKLFLDQQIYPMKNSPLRPHEIS